MVANDPWQKSAAAPVTPAALRLEMTMAAAAGHPRLQVSDLEIRRGGASYMIDTVEEPATVAFTLSAPSMLMPFPTALSPPTVSSAS